MSERFADDAGRYQLESRIATGGMGEVWRATDTVLGRAVAVKLLKTELADDAIFRQRFETEARNAAALHHPGVAAVFDVGEKRDADGSGTPRPFLVMELVEGRPLSALVGPGRELAPDAVRELLAQVGDALGAAHRAGIVHRDVKPANLLVTPQQKVKVTDFGIARAAEAVGITRTGAIMGTPQYISPEQARGEPATAASDVYALGVVAFECLTGRRPFDAESAVATALAHIREPVPELPVSVPRDLAAVVTRALSKDPAERFADGAAMAAALRNPATAVTDVPRRPVVVPPPVPPVDDEPRTQVFGAAAPVPVPTPSPDDRQDDDRRTGRGAGPIVLAVLLVVALAVVLTLLLTQGDDSDDVATDGTASQTGSRTPRSTSASSEPSSSEPTEPATVTIDPDDYVGQPVDEVRAELDGLGFAVGVENLDNDDPERNGLVSGVDPSGELEEGAAITVTYYADAPEETEPPSEEPTSEEPSESPSESLSEAPSEPPSEESPSESPATEESP